MLSTWSPCPLYTHSYTQSVSRQNKQDCSNIHHCPICFFKNLLFLSLSCVTIKKKEKKKGSSERSYRILSKKNCSCFELFYLSFSPESPSGHCCRRVMIGNLYTSSTSPCWRKWQKEGFNIPKKSNWNSKIWTKTFNCHDEEWCKTHHKRVFKTL